MYNWNEMLGNLAGKVGAEVIGREASPLRTEEWEKIDTKTVEVVRRQVKFRNILAQYGILDVSNVGAGVTQKARYERGTRQTARTDMSGEPQRGDQTTLTRVTTPVPLHHAEGLIDWRNLEASRRGLEPLDMVEAIGAATEVALQEDTFFAIGDSDLSIDGLLNPTNRQTMAGGAWTSNPGTVYDKVIAADKLLNDDSGAQYVGDRVLFVSAAEKALMLQRYGSGSDYTPYQQLLDSKVVKDIVVVPSDIRAAGTAALVAMNPAYFQAEVTVDMRTDPLPMQGRNTWFTTWAAGTFEAKKPRAVVELTSIT